MSFQSNECILKLNPNASANKWALVTGASRGIGNLAVQELMKRGFNLIFWSRSHQHNAAMMQKMEELHLSCASVAAELSDASAVQNALAAIDASGIPVDIILNNAGVQIAYRTEYLTTPPEDYAVSFQINTISPMMICYHFLPKMIERGFGRIVNTTSGIALEPEQAGYSASKAALDKVSIDLGSKLNGTNVTINLTDPGWCRTDLGGPNAPNAPESAIPGVIVGAFINDKRSGRLFRASDFYGLTLEEAVAKAETMSAPY